MTEDVKILECNIQPAGCPFMVTDELKDSLLPPKTTGFISYVMGPDHNHPNIVFQQVVTTRRGKGGKHRINNNTLLCPIFKVTGIDSNIMFPEKEERKHFVNLDTVPSQTVSIIGKNDPIDNNFLAWLLARSLLVKELDQAVYNSDHRIMKIASLNSGQRQVRVWPKDNKNTLKVFVNHIEGYRNNDEIDIIHESFCLPEIKDNLLKDIKAKELLLLIPKMEYQQKVSKVLLDALSWVESFISKNKDLAIDKAKVKTAINEERKSITQKNKIFNNIVTSRLDTISKTRIVY